MSIWGRWMGRKKTSGELRSQTPSPLLEQLEPRLLLDAGFGPQQVITTQADSARSVYTADLDGDGDQDVLSASSLYDKIAWYENLGGSFGPEHVITTQADGANSVYAADLDGDGDQDVLSASYFDDKIAWYENDGNGAFGPQQVITTQALGPYSVYAVDLDGDGDKDVLSSSSWDDKIAWYENLGGSFGPQQVITTQADGAMSVHTADLDGDGDQDVLSASFYDNKIAWYENLGGTFGPQQVITTQAGWAVSVYAADLDQDGDQDVLSASHGYIEEEEMADPRIAWYENLGGSFGPQQVISTQADGPRSVYAADLDGDGDKDVLSASWNDAKIAWYENLTVTIPGRPTNVSASLGDYPDKVQVTWDPVDGATSYEVWRGVSSDSGSAVRLQDNWTGTTLDDATASTLQVYWYWVKAKGPGGTSDFSNSDAGYRAMGVSASDGYYSDKVRVAWDAVDTATSYEVWRDIASDGLSATKIGETNLLTYDDASGAQATTYWYWVKAKNESWTSDLDACVSNAGHRALDGLALTDFVTRFYVECLGREPEPDGLYNWADDLADGTRTGADLAVGFMFSQEYFNRNRADSDFVDDCYQAFFNREPDVPGKAHWLGILGEGAPREDVLYGFVYSGEFTNLAAQYSIDGYSQDGLRVYRVRQFVTRFYVECLDRQPDPDGLADWTADLLAQVRAGVEVAFGFMFSPEYLLRNRTDSEFVDDSYRAFFGREPDAGGKANWVAALAGGTSRVDVLKGFTDSLEFANLCGVYDILPNLP